MIILNFFKIPEINLKQLFIISNNNFRCLDCNDSKIAMELFILVMKKFVCEIMCFYGC